MAGAPAMIPPMESLLAAGVCGGPAASLRTERGSGTLRHDVRRPVPRSGGRASRLERSGPFEPRTGRARPRGRAAARLLCRHGLRLPGGSPAHGRARSRCAAWAGRAGGDLARHRGRRRALRAARGAARGAGHRRGALGGDAGRAPGRDDRARDLERRRRPGALADGGGADRRRRPRRPPRLRRRGHRPVPGRDGGLGPSPLRRRPRLAVPAASGRAVLAAHPRRGARQPARAHRVPRAAAGARPPLRAPPGGARAAHARGARGAAPVALPAALRRAGHGEGATPGLSGREAITERDGRWALSWDPVPLGIVTWRPRP
jgi:hypothetical protein